MLFVPTFLYDNLSENIDNKFIKIWYNNRQFSLSTPVPHEKPPINYVREQRAKVRACTRPWRLPR